ncbi:MAG: hypothetical protein FWH17_06265 [Oscillospiraceae bacterium]|nr:hypothetical protein [Oscillospiraceae bacterium]
MARGKRKIYDDDDGRVIAPMNISGMPWHSEKSGLSAQTMPSQLIQEKQEKLTLRENIAFTFGVLKAVSLVLAVFLGTFLAFILFCIYVWFR